MLCHMRAVAGDLHHKQANIVVFIALRGPSAADRTLKLVLTRQHRHEVTQCGGQNI